MPVSSRDQDDAPEDTPVAWHNQTSTLLAASVAGLAAIALVITLISYVARQFSEPEPAPLYYVPPATTASTTKSGLSTTTGTITSTSPPITSDINPGSTTETSPESSTTTRSTRAPRTRETDDEDGTTTRNRPRTNVTRTVSPVP